MKKQNLAAINKKSPSTIYFMTLNIKKENYDIELVDTNSEEKSLKIKIDGRELLIHSKREPLKEASRFVDKILHSDGNFFVVYGMGLGYHVSQLYEKVIKKRSETKLLVIEPSFKIFNKALDIYDFSEIILDDRVEFAVGDDVEDTREKLSKLFKIYENEQLKVFEFNVYRRIFGDFFTKIDETLKNALSVGISNYTTVMNYIDDWHENIVSNLKHIIKSPGLSDYQGKFENKAAIVVSAGPSLDKNGHYLKQAKGKALIIAVDTVVKPMLSMGIEPDVIISVDSQYANYKHLEGVDLKDVYCVCSPIVHPNIPELFDGKTIFFNFFFQMSIWLEQHVKQNGILFTGGSVATVAFDFARKIGANPIVFVGQDLAFTGDYHHCVECYTDKLFFNDFSKDISLAQLHKEDIIKSDKTKIKEKDIFGNDVITYRVLRDYCKWIEFECGKTIGKMINATEGGILKENVDIMRLKDVISEYMKEDLDVKEIFMENFKILPKKNIYDLYKTINMVDENLTYIINKSPDIRKKVRKLFDLYSNKNFSEEYNKLVNKIEKTGKEFEKKISIASFIVEKFQTKYWPLLRTLKKNPEYTLRNEEEKKLEELNLKYEIIEEISITIRVLIRKSEKYIKEYLKNI
ncbi:MAG: DUF115 domain-containing protein [Candidatus Muirbacterium halophilum]|nr:DUF115 domain-containing protein [Candidatus Muirbacterium halophilum]MCK9474753.1 DUF115 domain-containing protein [Candidatus Muirbacterium halophilum]